MGQKIGNSAEPSPSTLNYFQSSLPSAEEGYLVEVPLRHTSGTAAFALAWGSQGMELIEEAAGWRVLQLDPHTESVGVWKTSMTALLCHQPPEGFSAFHLLSVATKPGLLLRFFIHNIP